MGVEVSCVAGIGVKIEEEELDLLMASHDIVDPGDLRDILCGTLVRFQYYGSCYTCGGLRVALTRDSKEEFLAVLPSINAMLKREFTEADVEFIRELYWF